MRTPLVPSSSIRLPPLPLPLNRGGPGATANCANWAQPGRRTRRGTTAWLSEGLPGTGDHDADP
jgi:hypothetical protein